MNMNGYGLWGLLVLGADLYALFSIAQSSDTVGKKVLWVLLVLLLPVLGFIIWLIAGPRSKTG